MRPICSVLEKVKMSDPTVVQVLALSEAAIVVDSAYRPNALQSPGNFGTQLPGAIRDGKRVHHQSLSWAQSMYAHTRETMMFRIRVNGYVPFVGGDPWLYCFMTPYYMFTSPDGTDETVPFATPVDCSYAADLQAALNNSMYVSNISTGQMLFAAPGVTFTVRYAKGSGFLITCVGGTFQIEQNTAWLQQAHDVHGFGERVTTSGQLQYASPTAGGYAEVITSATAPNLIPSRFIGISCPELAQRRQMSSFSNVNSPAFGSAEINVFSTSYKDNGAWATKSTPSDPTVINLNPTDGIGQLTMGMFNNQGVEINAGNPWAYFIAMLMTTADAQAIATLTRSASLQNKLVLMWSNGDIYITGQFKYTFPKIPANVLCKSDELMHKILVQSMS